MRDGLMSFGTLKIEEKRNVRRGRNYMMLTVLTIGDEICIENEQITNNVPNHEIKMILGNAYDTKQELIVENIDDKIIGTVKIK